MTAVVFKPVVPLTLNALNAWLPPTTLLKTAFPVTVKPCEPAAVAFTVLLKSTAPPVGVTVTLATPNVTGSLKICRPLAVVMFGSRLFRHPRP